MLKGQKGITLVALIITIIVLLILAGVSISLVIGQNGILNQSKQAVDFYNNTVKNESGDFDNLYNEMNAYMVNAAQQQ